MAVLSDCIEDDWDKGVLLEDGGGTICAVGLGETMTWESKLSQWLYIKIFDNLS